MPRSHKRTPIQFPKKGEEEKAKKSIEKVNKNPKLLARKDPNNPTFVEESMLTPSPFRGRNLLSKHIGMRLEITAIGKSILERFDAQNDNHFSAVVRGCSDSILRNHGSYFYDQDEQQESQSQCVPWYLRLPQTDCGCSISMHRCLGCGTFIPCKRSSRSCHVDHQFSEFTRSNDA